MDIDLNPISDWNTARKHLIPLSERDEFAWLRPILRLTLKEYVINALKQRKPVWTTYSPFEFERNVSVANDLINRCLTRRTDIYELESAAISAALEYQRDYELARSEEALETGLLPVS